MRKSPKSDIELYVIAKVKEIRVRLDMSQDDLAIILDTDRSFIGQVESLSNPAKYNLNHLNKLAIEFKCSPRDFMPDNAISPESNKSAK
jgi:transcriptional regulator with XRE-family HTH domain